MGYEVVAAELRAAAGRHEAVRTELGTTPIDITTTTPEVVGHTELAAWIGAIEDQCRKAHGELTEGQQALQDRLEAQALDYETTDDDVRLRFRQPLLDPYFQHPALGPQSPFGAP